MLLLQKLLYLATLAALVVCPKRDEDSTTEFEMYSSQPKVTPPPSDPCWRASQCPEWSLYDNESVMCQCPESTSNYILECDPDNHLLVLNCACITFDKSQNLYEYGFCTYGCDEKESVYAVGYHQMPGDVSEWDIHVCGRFNRSGTLCGKCDENHDFYQRAYSFDMTCIQCTGSVGKQWFQYLLSAFFPLTLFCILIMILKVNIYSSQLQGFVLYSQFMTISALSRILFRVSQTRGVVLFQIVKLFSAIYGIWNLDFFKMYYPGYCLKIGSLASLSLNFAIALYPMVFMAFTLVLVKLYDQNFKPLVFLWKPFGVCLGMFQQNWGIKTSAIDSFSTFFFLSNMKFLSVCFDILVPVKVHQFTDPRMVTYTWRLYYDSTIPYFKGAHSFHGIMAIILLILFVLLPVLLLLLYPFQPCHKLLRAIPNRWQILLHTFVDSFQGCYKDGIKTGTRDCRWFSATILIARFLLLLAYANSLDAVFFAHSAIIFTVLVILVVVVDPFKAEHSHLSLVLAMYMIILAAFHVSGSRIVLTYDGFLYIVAVLAGIMPLVHVCALLLHWWIKTPRNLQLIEN